MAAGERKRALDSGAISYFTGIPCKYGHVSERWAKDGHCQKCDLDRRHNAVLKEKRCARMRDWQRHEDENKKKARQAVNNAISGGKLNKEPCIKCGSDKSQAHHEDYSHPLDIIWFCAKHHKERHREMETAS